jgi:hypothetical protein
MMEDQDEESDDKKHGLTSIILTDEMMKIGIRLQAALQERLFA